MAADPLQIGTLIASVAAILTSVAGFLTKRAESTGETDKLRTEVATLRGENGALRVESATLKGEVLALRAKLDGDTSTSKARIDKNDTDIAGILTREHQEAEARGKLRGRVEYLVGLLERSPEGE
jgi:hypothetical protein